MSHDSRLERMPRSSVRKMSLAVRDWFERVLGRVDDLTVEVAQLKQENQRLRADNQQLRQENEALRDQVRQLREQLHGYHHTAELVAAAKHAASARQAAPHLQKARRPTGTLASRAAADTHERRPLIPTSECHDVQALKPEQYRHCQSPLLGDDPEPLRHQVWELPPIEPQVTEYRRHRLTCGRCGKTTCADLPVGVPSGQAGPRLTAFVALLMGYFRQSKRRTVPFLESLLNQPCSAAWMVKLQDRATLALRPAYDELVAALPEQPIIGADETPSKEASRKTRLWTFVAAKFSVFTLRYSRGAPTIRELLGAAFKGVVTCDRAKMYWMLSQLQGCWAHLKCDFQALAEDSNLLVRVLGEDLLEQTSKLFELGSRCRDGTLSRAELKHQMQPIRKKLERLLKRGADAHSLGVCRELCRYPERLWAFLDVDGLEPTNNRSERALRPAVIWRKLSFGTQSARGSRFVETMLTVIETCRQQNHNALNDITAAVQANFNGQPTPPILHGA